MQTAQGQAGGILLFYSSPSCPILLSETKCSRKPALERRSLRRPESNGDLRLFFSFPDCNIAGQIKKALQ